MTDPRAIAVVALLVFAGCAGVPSSGPTPTDTPKAFTLEVETTAGERVLVSVALVETNSGVAVDYADGRTDRLEGVTDPADLQRGALDGAVRVRPLDEVTDATAIDLAGSPGTAGMPLEGDPQFALYVVSVPGDALPGDDGQPVPATDARDREWGVARCDPGGVVDSLTVGVSPEGVTSGHACAF